DWVFMAPLAEFAINSSISSSTGFAPFELNYGYMPRLASLPAESTQYAGVQAFAARARLSVEMAHDAIIESRVRSAVQANKRRSVGATFAVGDKVYLSTVNLNLPKERARKLAPKYIGPYAVTVAHP
ncbi:hypothetical protein PLICRDRAFT_81937, partial [Plicaturopsis crispa FD-325 SS-3]